MLRAVHIPAPVEPSAQHFRDFRDTLLVRELGSVDAANEALKDVFRAAALGQAGVRGLRLRGRLQWTGGEREMRGTEAGSVRCRLDLRRFLDSVITRAHHRQTGAAT